MTDVKQASTNKIKSVRDTGSRGVGKPNFLAGFFGWFWLAVVIIPIYYVVVTSLKNQGCLLYTSPSPRD